jgi:hypothetical protein
VVPVKFRPLQFAQNIQLTFVRPILDWDGLMPKYFNMILTSVGDRIPVLASQFSASVPGKISDTYARYNIYGGASSITLFPEKLVFDFPQLLPPDIPLVRDLLRIVHDAFAADFSQAIYGRVDLQISEHIELLPPSTVAGFLAPYQIKNVAKAFAEVEAVVEPAIRFAAKNSKPPRTYATMAEQSLLNAAALYVWETISLTDATAVPTFDDKFKLVAQIGALALKAFNLEHSDVVAE